MNDELLMNNYLLLLKSTMEVYVHGTLESTNAGVRDILKSGLDETVKHQASTYDKMNEFGWYTVNNVDSKTIQKTINSIKMKN